VKPQNVVFDPLTNLVDAGAIEDARSLLLRVMDDMKRKGITVVCTVLTNDQNESDLGISSMVDTWIALNNDVSDGARARTLQIVKSRGMAHSDKIRPFRITSQGITQHKA
jgi:circadian clock protein KaiC